MTTPTRMLFPFEGGDGGTGSRPHLLQLIPCHGHVPNLSFGPDLLAVHVNLHSRVSLPDCAEGFARVGQLGAEQVDHDGPGRERGGISEWQIENGAQVLLELARHGAFDRPMPGVVWPHRQLIDEQLLPNREHLNRKNSDDTRLLSDRSRDGLGLRVERGRNRGGGRHLEADAVPLDGRDERPCPNLAGGPPSDKLRHLNVEGNLFFEENRGSVGVVPWDVGGRGDDSNALAVVAATRRLRHGCSAEFRDRSIDLVTAGGLPPSRVRGIKLRPHDEFVLGEDERIGRGSRADLVEDIAGNMLVLDGDRVAVGEGDDRVSIVGSADLAVADRLSRRPIIGLDKRSKLNSESDRRFLHHPRQLAASDDADDGRGRASTRADYFLSHVLYANRVFSRFVRRLLRGQTLKEWLIEFLRFCTVGLGAYVVDVGLFNLLAYHWPIDLPFDQSMTAKTISVSVSIVFAWTGNRLWTFRSKQQNSRRREFAMFVLVNIGGMAVALACLAVSRFVLGFDSQFADNIAANVVGLVLGTAFRYVLYRYVVFNPLASAAAAPRSH